MSVVALGIFFRVVIISISQPKKKKKNITKIIRINLCIIMQNASVVTITMQICIDTVLIQIYLLIL